MKDEGHSIPLSWIFWLSAIVILTAMTSAIVLTFVLPFSDSMNIFHYRITIVLVCFVLSSISALLFAAKVDIKGNVGLLSISIAGPSAMWLAALLIFNWIFPEKNLYNPISEDEFLQTWIKTAELDAGWLPYSKWKNKLGRTANLFDKQENEEHYIKTMLPRVFYHGNQQAKLKEPTLQTVFVYLDTAIIKFQRIQGSKGDEPAHVYTTAATSLPGGDTSSFLFVRSDNAIIEATPILHGDWKKINDDDIDCMTVALYLEDNPIIGDWLYVDTPKYIDKNTDGATIDLTLLALEKVKDFEMWQMSASLDIQSYPAPLNYLKVPSIAHGLDDALISGFDDWFRMFNTFMAANPDAEASRLLRLIKQILSDKGLMKSEFKVFFRNAMLKTKSTHHLDDLNKGVIATFLWEEPRLTALQE